MTDRSQNPLEPCTQSIEECSRQLCSLAFLSPSSFLYLTSSALYHNRRLNLIVISLRNWKNVTNVRLLASWNQCQWFVSGAYLPGAFPGVLGRLARKKGAPSISMPATDPKPTVPWRRGPACTTRPPWARRGRPA